jgi:phosphoserine aminotransferase
MTRIHNFSAGPAVLPVDVLEQVQQDLLSLPGVGMSVLEISHRSKPFDEIIQGCEADFRTLAGIPENYHVLFLQGGASLQFSMVPMNLLPPGGSADYIVTGVWSQKAVKEAKRVGAVKIAGTTESENFKRVPKQSELTLDPNAAVVHYTTNNTIFGTEFSYVPDVGSVPLVADMSSDIFSRPIEMSKFGLIYAGAQKNAGPAGLTIVIVREDLTGQAAKGTPSVMDYKLQADADSMLNTPATYSLYIAGLVFKWIKQQGGLAEMEKRNVEKAKLLYDCLDASGLFRNPVAKEDRSRMNVPFTLRDKALDEAFLKGAAERGLTQLKGHRSVGGMRASIYNAMPVEGVRALVAYLREFEQKHG